MPLGTLVPGDFKRPPAREGRFELGPKPETRAQSSGAAREVLNRAHGLLVCSGRCEDIMELEAAGVLEFAQTHTHKHVHP